MSLTIFHSVVQVSYSSIMQTGPPKLKGIECGVAYHIQALLSVKSLKVFKYAVEFHFNIPNSMAIQNKLPNILGNECCIVVDSLLDAQ